MKKTVLSLAFVLSISLAFGTETKHVVGESKESVRKANPSTAKTENKGAKSQDVIECFILSCRTVCGQVPQPFDIEESIDVWEACEDFYCN